VLPLRHCICWWHSTPEQRNHWYLEVVNAATVQRALCASVAGLQKVRVRLTAYTSGSCAVTINSDDCKSISPYANDTKAATLTVSVTAAVSTAVTATLPAVAGLRHYIDRIDVVRSATAALTAAATPLVSKRLTKIKRSRPQLARLRNALAAWVLIKCYLLILVLVV